MRYDDVQSLLGDFGRYQRVMFVLLCLPIMFVGIQIFSPVFTLATPKHRCAIPGLPNDTYAIQNEKHKALVGFYIPPGDEDDDYSKCRIYIRNIEDVSVNITMDKTIGYVFRNTSTDTTTCTEWVFDKSVFENTAITETQLVCSSAIYKAHASTAMNVGGVFGFLFSGPLSDRFGRKVVSLVDLMVMIVSSVMLVWLPHIYVFIFIRLLIGVGFFVFFNVIFVYAMEFVGPSARTVCGILVEHFWAVGILFQSLVAYYVRAWRTVQLITSLPLVLFLLYWWKLPDSGRWLFANGHVEKGKKVLTQMANVNKVDIDIDNLTIDVEDKDSSAEGWIFLQLFKTKTLALRSLVVWYNWAVVSLLYYGLSLNVGNLGGDIFLNFFISAVMEFLGYTVCIPVMLKFGRKRFYCACMIVGGTALLLVIFPEMLGNKSTAWVSTALAMAGKLASSAAFAVIYLFSAELFPTVVRGTTLGICAACSLIGAIIAPYIVELASLLQGQSAKIMPLAIFGVSSLTAGLTSLTLPETSHANMPDTIRDMKGQKWQPPRRLSTIMPSRRGTHILSRHFDTIPRAKTDHDYTSV